MISFDKNPLYNGCFYIRLFSSSMMLSKTTSTKWTGTLLYLNHRATFSKRQNVQTWKLPMKNILFAQIVNLANLTGRLSLHRGIYDWFFWRFKLIREMDKHEKKNCTDICSTIDLHFFSNIQKLLEFSIWLYSLLFLSLSKIWGHSYNRNHG